MNADRGSAAMEFFAQLEALFCGGCDIRWRDKTWVHLTLLNAEGLAAILPDFSNRTRNSGLSSDAATS
jgi:hypothetical protein